MKFNPYILIAIIYFFFNSFLLPFGLTYTSLLSPLIFIWVTRKTGHDVLIPFIALLALFSIAHISQGADLKTYIISVINYSTVYIFCWGFYLFIHHSNSFDKILRYLVLINLVFCLLALILYPFGYANFAWMNQDLSKGIEDVSRLKLLTYEASYYALLFTPVFFYFLFQLLKGTNKMNSWVLLIGIIIPYLLSFSLGTISAILLSLAMVFIFHFRYLVRLKNFSAFFFLTTVIFICCAASFYFLFPANELFSRIANILNGEDSSGQGRTFDAFYLASEIANLKSSLWGVGPGQIKILGGDIIRSYYLYDLDYDNIAIPNAVAETYAIFGWIGIILRFTIIGLFFYFSRVWTNHYRLALFIFIFIYQFTGSFITNTAEYVIWIISFTPSVSFMNVKQPYKGVSTYSLQNSLS